METNDINELDYNANDGANTPTEQTQPEAENLQPESEKRIELLNYEALEGKSREELLTYLKKIVGSYTAIEISKTVEAIRTRFDELQKSIEEEKYNKFIADGGDKADFKYNPDIVAQDMKGLMAGYYEKRKTELEAIEKQKIQNAITKRSIIDKMTQMLTQDDCSQHIKEFKDLMQEWKDCGPVPANETQDITAAYKSCVDKFYDTMRLNRELRELDMKRNYDEKIKLCEQAEALTQMASATKAFRNIQQLHAQWKTLGSVPAEYRESIWERFKAATSIVNDKFHKHVEQNKKKEEANYEAKLALCHEVEAMLNENYTSAKDWEKATQRVTEIREKWRTIGYAPKEHNDTVYANFRQLCDRLFDGKRSFFKKQNSDYAQNYEAKIELCKQAEELANSTDWKRTTEQLIGLQKKWKAIGPVPKKHAEEIWIRFRAACDTFFNNKNKHFSGISAETQENLAKKQALLEELKNYTMPEDADECMKALQDFQRRWNEIGFVPFKKKNEINAEFSSIINKYYDKFGTDDQQHNIQRFKAKVDMMLQEIDGHDKLLHERKKLLNRLKQVESDMVTLENNIGFFAKSQNSDSLVADFQHKITDARQTIELLSSKIEIIDEALD